MNNISTTTSNKLANTPTGVIAGAVGVGFLLGKIIAFPSIWMLIVIAAVAIYFKRR